MAGLRPWLQFCFCDSRHLFCWEPWTSSWVVENSRPESSTEKRCVAACCFLLLRRSLEINSLLVNFYCRVWKFDFTIDLYCLQQGKLVLPWGLHSVYLERHLAGFIGSWLISNRTVAFENSAGQYLRYSGRKRRSWVKYRQKVSRPLYFLWFKAVMVFLGALLAGHTCKALKVLLAGLLVLNKFESDWPFLCENLSKSSIY